MYHDAFHKSAVQLFKHCSVYLGLEESPYTLLKLAFVIKSLDKENSNDLCAVAESIQYATLDNLWKLATRQTTTYASAQHTIEPIQEGVLIRANLVWQAWIKRYPRYAKESIMLEFDRFDITEAYYCLEYDYNVSGCLQERLTENKRKMSVGYQLARMQFKPGFNLSYDTLSDNGKAIYDQFVSSHKL